MNVSSQLHKMLLYTGYVKQNVFITLLISFEKKTMNFTFVVKISTVSTNTAYNMLKPNLSLQKYSNQFCK